MRDILLKCVGYPCIWLAAFAAFGTFAAVSWMALAGLGAMFGIGYLASIAANPIVIMAPLVGDHVESMAGCVVPFYVVVGLSIAAYLACRFVMIASGIPALWAFRKLGQYDMADWSQILIFYSDEPDWLPDRVSNWLSGLGY